MIRDYEHLSGRALALKLKELLTDREKADDNTVLIEAITKLCDEAASQPEAFTHEWYDAHASTILDTAREHVEAGNGSSDITSLVGFTCTADELVSWAELIMGSFPGAVFRHGGDVLMNGFSGFWLMGIERVPGKGWLAIDQESYFDVDEHEWDEKSLPEGEDTYPNDHAVGMDYRALREERQDKLNKRLQYLTDRWKEDSPLLQTGWRAIERQKDIEFKHVYLLDASAAIRSLKAGRERWGRDFDDGTCDYGQNDCGVQQALLGEVVYG